MTTAESKAPDRRLTAAQISAALEAWLPARLGAAVRIDGIVAPKGTGFSNQTFLFDAHCGGETTALVLQAAPAASDGPGGLFSRYDFASMARVQQQLAAVSKVPVARVRWHEIDSAVLGVPFYIMERVAGRAPTDKPPYHRGSWFTELPAEQQTATWWSGIDAMAKLHALDADVDGFAFLSATPWGMVSGSDAARTRLAQWREFMVWADPEPCEPIAEALDELARSAPKSAPLRVHWGDAKLSNCMVADGTVQALLDWELCGLSVPEEDLAHWLMLDWSLWAVTGSTRLASLPSPERTIARYEELSGRAAVDVLWWFRFGMVRLAIIYHRIMTILRHKGHVPASATLTSVNPMVPLMAPIFEQDRLPC